MSDVFLDTEPMVIVTVEPVDVPVVTAGNVGRTGAVGPQGPRGPMGPIGPPGVSAPSAVEVFYVERTTTQTLTPADGSYVVMESSNNYSGFAVLFEAQITGVIVAPNTQMIFSLWQDGACLGRIGMVLNSGNQIGYGPIHMTRRLAPPSGIHVLQLRAEVVNVGGTAALLMGAGGSAATELPGYMRASYA